MKTIYTIGHSTHPIDDFLGMLRAFGVDTLVDIRTVPKSRHNPQFLQDALKQSLEHARLSYVYLKELGGLRGKHGESVNLGWRNASFRNYADYMQTPEFVVGLDELMSIAESSPTAIMCAEAVPWRCHRSLVGDALLIRGWQVEDIMSATKATPHKLTHFAKVDGLTITYPAYDDPELR